MDVLELSWTVEGIACDWAGVVVFRLAGLGCGAGDITAEDARAGVAETRDALSGMAGSTLVLCGAMDTSRPVCDTRVVQRSPNSSWLQCPRCLLRAR